MNTPSSQDTPADLPAPDLVSPEAIEATGTVEGHCDAPPVNSSATMQPLSDQFIFLERCVGYIVGLVILAIVIPSTAPLLLLAQGGRWWVVIAVLAGWLILASIFFYFAQIFPKLVHRNTHWRLDQQGFLIHRGVIWKHRISIPAARVQHIDVGQGPLQRWKGLGKITIHTAGTKNASVELDGLDHKEALRIRDLLIMQKELQDEHA